MTHQDILLSRLQNLFYIKNDTLYWKARDLSDFKSKNAWSAWNSRFSMKPAGNIDDAGYIRLGVTLIGKKRHYRTHRIIWAMHYGKWPEGEIDHINHERVDNRIENLRETSHKNNLRNQKKHSTNKSGTCGVCWDKENSKWLAFITVSGNKIRLGRFRDKSIAIEARKSAEITYKFHENHGV